MPCRYLYETTKILPKLTKLTIKLIIHSHYLKEYREQRTTTTTKSFHVDNGKVHYPSSGMLGTVHLNLNSVSLYLHVFNLSQLSNQNLQSSRKDAQLPII